MIAATNSHISRKGFKKGHKLATGRPKGCVNETTKRYARFRTLASDDYEKAYKMLWECMQAKEGWAYNLFFKELIPKKVYIPTILPLPANDGVDSRIGAIMKELPQFGELTHDEALNEIKTLSSVKIADSMVNDAVKRESREELMSKVETIRKILADNKEIGNDNEKN